MKENISTKNTKLGAGGRDERDRGRKGEVEDLNHCKTDKDDVETTERPSEPAPPKRILVVDDEPVMRKLLTSILKNAGYEVTLAADGEEGLQRFREKPADLIITDIVMPELGGHDFIIEIKKDFPDVKFIAISGNEFFGPEIDLDIAKTLGAERVFGKPFKVDEILKAVRELLQ